MDNILGIIQLTIYIGSLVSFYWVLRSDIRLLQQKIKEIEKDRKSKWDDYKVIKSRNCDKLNEVIGGIREMNRDIKWLIKKVDK